MLDECNLMIFYYGYPIGKNLGDDAVFKSFVYSLRPEYRKLITLNPSKDCKLAVLGGGSLITNQPENGISGFYKILREYKIKQTFIFGTGYDYFDNVLFDVNWIKTISEYFKEEDCFWRGPITLEKAGYGQVSGDPAVLFEMLYGSNLYDEYPNFEIGISFGESYGNYGTEEIANDLSLVNGSRVLMPVCNEDKILMRKYYPNDFCLERLGWGEYVNFLKYKVKKMFSMKLHSTIAAYIAGIEYKSYPYRLKCLDFEESKSMINLEPMIKRLNEKIKGELG